MAFELGHVGVERLELGRRTELVASTLQVEADALRAHLSHEVEGIRSLQVHVARPGESTRIACVKDVIEPRFKMRGDRIGEGRTHALANVAVVSCGQIVGFQEGLIDMSGPGAAHTPFSRLSLLVLEVDAAPELDAHRRERVVREAGLAAAAFLGRVGAGVEPDRIERVAPEETACGGDLPRVVYVAMLLSQGLLHDNWVEGRNAREGLPRSVNPAFLLDGGVVSGNCVSACDKNTTWHHQNDAVVRALLAHHGSELDFEGVVLTNAPTRLAEKEASAHAAAALVSELGAHGAVLAKEGFGNPDADLMLLIRGLEGAGIRAVALTDEFAGADGASQSLADATPEADALVSVGNANARLVLPPVQRTLGPMESVPRLAGAFAESLRPDGGVEVELQTLLGSTNQIGFERLTCREV